MSQGSGIDTEPVSGRVLTLPNVLSALRLVGVPIFLWAIVGERWVTALVVLALSGISDYLDGKIARRYHLVSRVGQLLDPLADRLYTMSTLIGLAWTHIVPWWLVAVLFARDGFMALVILALRRAGHVGLPVHFVGKAATFNLLYAFPILLLGQIDASATIARPIGWAFAWWGVGLYLLAAVIYAIQAAPLLRAEASRRASSPDRGPA